MQTIICPHCKKSFEISEALDTEYREKLVAELESKHKGELEAQKKDLEERTAKKVRDELEIKLKDQANEAQEAKERSKKLQEELLETAKLVRELKTKDEDRAREMEKKLEQESEIIRTKAVEDAQKESQTKLAEKEKQLQDALKEAEDMKRKLTQGSQQAQGEVFELEFEETLKKQYPNDKINPVGKGIKGGDIVQEVWDSRGNYTGKILWELKNTKTWSEGWIEKLRTDKRAITADEAILISEIMPTDVKKAGYRKGVWVTERQFVIPIADMMRAKIIQLYGAKKAAEGKDSKMEVLYGYLSGTEFKNRVEAIIEAFTSMQQEIEKEKRYFSSKWARDEKHIRMVIDSTYGMHGDLKGIMHGQLPTIAGIEETTIIEIESGE